MLKLNTEFYKSYNEYLLNSEHTELDHQILKLM